VITVPSTDTSLIPISALAKELGVNRRTLARWIARGDTPVPLVFHRRLYFERGAIEVWKKTWGNAMVSKSAVCNNNREISKVTS
jgi:hypothetical protein